MGPIGSGKTSTVLMKFMALAQRQKPSTRDGIRKFKFCVVRDTYRQLWRTTIPTWNTWMPQSVGTWQGAKDSPVIHTIRMNLADGTVCEVIAEFIPAFPKYRRYSVRREGDSAIRIMKL